MTESQYPEYSPKTNRIYIETTTNGVLNFSVEFARIISSGEYSEKKPGTCGSCGEKSKIYVFEPKTDDEGALRFIYLCEECLSYYQKEFSELFDTHGETIVSKNI